MVFRGFQNKNVLNFVKLYLANNYYNFLLGFKKKFNGNCEEVNGSYG